MDTSETYIKMCDHKKIQGDRGIPIFGASELRREKPMYRRGGVYTGIDMNSTTGRVVWLPRQDQIQEMMPKCDCPICLIQGLHRFAEEYIELMFDTRTGGTMEQLWLAFYMYEKHNLKWNGEEWE